MAHPARRGGSRGGDDDDRGRGDQDREHERYRGHEHEEGEYDNPREHLEIERRRFAGGLPPTPELYALAREQWYRLPGVFVRPSMDPVVGDQAGDATPPAGQPNQAGKGPGQ
jgi:hypothetical protein